MVFKRFVDFNRLTSRRQPQQEPARRQPRPGQGILLVPPVVPVQPAAPSHSGEGSLHHPPAAENREFLDILRFFDNAMSGILDGESGVGRSPSGGFDGPRLDPVLSDQAGYSLAVGQ